MRPALRQGLYMFSLCLLLPGPCKAGRAIFSGRESLGATCLAPTYACFPHVCYSPACAKRVALLFGGRWSMSATCLVPGHIACFPCVFYSPACAKRVALFFVAGCDLPCARRVALFFLGGSCKCDLPSARRVALFLWVARLPTLLDPFWSSWAEI